MIKKSQEEMERKFLLKKLPYLTADVIYNITQYYKDGLRYRHSWIVGTSSIGTFEKIRKTKITTGHNIETEIETIDHIQFNKNKYGSAQERHEIKKKRHVFTYNDKKLEVDVFEDLNLIIMEVEDVTLNEIIKFPPQIENVILLEVTGLKQFDNYELAS